MKKVIFTFFAFILSTESIFAESISYIGLLGSHETININSDFKYQNEFSSQQFSQILPSGYGLEFLIGFRSFFGDYSLGLETNLSLKQVKAHSSFSYDTAFMGGENIFHIDISKKRSYGLFVLLGYKPQGKILMFIKPGIVISDLNIKVNKIIKPFCENCVTKFHKKITSPALGIGGDVMLNNLLLGRFEITHIIIKKRNIILNGKLDYSFSGRSTELKAGIILPIS